MAHAWNPRTQETEETVVRAPGQFALHTDNSFKKTNKKQRLGDIALAGSCVGCPVPQRQNKETHKDNIRTFPIKQLQ